ncbi:MAG TPA: hypothetical protein VJ302_32345 [Blastocatellia bacterium]|nr:hypothetical protein [Blastocatellia bacterium]
MKDEKTLKPEVKVLTVADLKKIRGAAGATTADVKVDNEVVIGSRQFRSSIEKVN